MKKIIGLLFTTIITLTIFSCASEDSSSCSFEKYDKFQREAMLSYVDGNYKEALHNFESAFNIINDESENDYFYAAASALRLEDMSKAKKFIVDAIVLNNANKSYFENFEEFDSYRDKEELISVYKNYESYQNKYLEKLKDPSVIKEMDKLIELDQKVRDANFSTEEMIEQDSLNIRRLIEITKVSGWQDRSWLILWHQRGRHNEDTYPWNYFRPLIDSLIDECEIRADYWAIYEDERLMRTEGFQKYGTYSWNFDSYPVKDVELVDQRRKELGMPPLWYMSKVYQNNLPDGYVSSRIDP